MWGMYNKRKEWIRFLDRVLNHEETLTDDKLRELIDFLEEVDADYWSSDWPSDKEGA